MPIGLGLACSHSPNVFIEPENWETRYKQAIGNVPQPAAAALETLEVRRAYAKRIEDGFADLRKTLAEYKPDALIMLSDDHNEMYDENLCQPTIAMFLGETGTGSQVLRSLNDDPAKVPKVNLKCDQELSKFIAKGLMDRHFDVTVTRTKETKSIGPTDRGMGHGFTRAAPMIMPELDIPTVLIWLNCYFEPLPTARRCLDLGKALTEICAKSKKRIAILASGGLSHDPRGARAGWIDEPLDHAVLEAFAEGEPDRLEALYKINSDTYHGGTGEIRNWLVVGGAMGECQARIIDYMPVHHIITGVGFAAWEPTKQTT